MNTKIIKIVILMLSLCYMTQAQDYTFSNHNLLPFSLNPALAGNANAYRAALNYRQQWPSLGNKYHTVRASYDQNIYKQMCSLGASYTYDNMANGIFQTNEFAGIYAHTFRLSRDNIFLRLGVQASFFSNYVDLQSLTFGDQYVESSRRILPNSVESFDAESRQFADFSFGAAMVFEEIVTFGAFISHISQPDNGFASTETNRLYRKFGGHINFTQDLDQGYRKKGVASDTYFFANASYQQQYNFKLAHLGVGFAINPILLGVSVKNDIGKINTFSCMLGGFYNGFQVYYTYDLPLNAKKNGSWSHEISLIYIWEPVKKDMCPVIYW